MTTIRKIKSGNWDMLSLKHGHKSFDAPPSRAMDYIPFS